MVNDKIEKVKKNYKKKDMIEKVFYSHDLNALNLKRCIFFFGLYIYKIEERIIEM
jgi:hypothetical protein